MGDIPHFHHKLAFSAVVHPGSNIGLQDIDVVITQSAADGSQHALDIGTNHDQSHRMDLFRLMVPIHLDAPLETTTQ